MAVEIKKDKVSLKLQFLEGMEDGKEKLKSKTISKLKLEAEDEKIYDTAEILSNLQTKPLQKVEKLETSILTRE